MGIIARNSEGKILACKVKTVAGQMPEVAEAMAIREGLEMAKCRRWQNIVVEKDSEVVFNCIKGKISRDPWRLKPILSEIRPEKKNFGRSQASLVRRESNGCANWLALVSEREMWSWVENHPTSLLEIANSDFLNWNTRYDRNTDVIGGDTV